MKPMILIIALALLLVGGYPPTAQAAQTAPDNTGRNVRDRNDATLTPGDQSESAADLSLTQEIRKAVVADDGLSTTAKNIKIITADGRVTLRGPVNTAQEKAAIVAKAQRIAGATKVDDQLEVTGR